MNNPNPLISVIIPVYNGEKTIKRAIDSVLSQDHKNIELIVIDDCSTDNTYQRLLDIKDSRLKVIKHKVNKERAAARNTGIKNTKGEYIAFIDDDDEWLVNRLSSQLEYLGSKDGKEYRAVISNYYFQKGDRWKLVKSRKEGNLFEDILNVEVSLGAGSTLLIEKSVVDEIGMFSEAHSRNEDLEFMLRYLLKYKLAVCPLPTIRVYGHSSKADGDMYLKAKLHFFDLFKTHIEKLPTQSQKRIYARQWLQVSKGYASEGRVVQTLKYLTKSLRYKFLVSTRFKVLPHEAYLGVIISLIINRMKRVFGKSSTGRK